MVPSASHPVWEQFAMGRKQIPSTKSTLNLLVQHNKMCYERDQSPANVKVLANYSFEFFTKFESLFSSELAVLTK